VNPYCLGYAYEISGFANLLENSNGQKGVWKATHYIIDQLDLNIIGSTK